MKSAIALLTALLLAGAVFAQQPKPKEEQEYNTVREYRNKVFTVQNRDPRLIASAVKLLGSGFKGSGLNVNEELRTITARDFPENLAAIEEAIKRLDRPAPQAPNMEMKVFVLIGSKGAVPAGSLPEELAPVVKQLQSTLSYSHYGLMTSALHRTKVGAGIEGSGVAETTLLGMTTAQDRPIFYNYTLRNISFGAAEQATIEIGNVQFSMRVPLDIGSGNISYQSVGFETPVALRQREKVVIGTTTMRDKALIVVVTATVNQ